MKVLRIIKKNVQQFMICFCYLGILLSCSSMNQRVGLDSADWKGSMHQLADSLSQLLPIVSNSQKFYSPEYSEKIETQLENMSRVSRSLNKDKFDPGRDPVIRFSSQQFAEQMQDALTQFRLGNKKFARQMLSGSTSYCISCHSRADTGKPELIVNWGADIAYLAPVERVEYLIATRDYDQAIVLMQELLNESTFVIKDIREFELAFEKLMAVLVRVKQDPATTGLLVASLSQSSQVPRYLKQRAQLWTKSIETWQRSATNAKRLTREQRLLVVKQLLREAERSHFVEKKAHLIELLRASGLLHQIMLESSQDAVYKESLYYAGLAAESLREINLWTLDESYYEACIRQSPHSELARRCFVRMESNLLSEIYTGDDGSYIPTHLKVRLRELERLANDEALQVHDAWIFRDTQF